MVDDNADDAELCLRELKKSDIPFVAHVVSTREDFAKQLQQKSFDVVISDYNMGGWTGMDALAVVKDSVPRFP